MIVVTVLVAREWCFAMAAAAAAEVVLVLMSSANSFNKGGSGISNDYNTSAVTKRAVPFYTCNSNITTGHDATEEVV